MGANAASLKGEADKSAKKSLNRRELSCPDRGTSEYVKKWYCRHLGKISKKMQLLMVFTKPLKLTGESLICRYFNSHCKHLGLYDLAAGYFQWYYRKHSRIKYDFAVEYCISPSTLTGKMNFKQLLQCLTSIS